MSAKVEWPPCAICGAETGKAERDSCEHTCRGCEGTRAELDGFPCLECGGTGLRGEWRDRALAAIAESMRELEEIARG